jgi:hypothetical protein
VALEVASGRGSFMEKIYRKLNVLMRGRECCHIKGGIVGPYGGGTWWGGGLNVEGWGVWTSFQQ